MTVLTVGSCLRQTVIWSFMFVFTLVLSRSLVDTVRSVLHGVANSSDIWWSHIMKVLGCHVTFVRRNSVTVVTLSSIYFDMKVWSLMYVVSVQSVSVQCTNWNIISWYTQTTKSSAVVFVVKILNTNVLLCDTLRGVQDQDHSVNEQELRWLYQTPVHLTRSNKNSVTYVMHCVLWIETVCTGQRSCVVFVSRSAPM